MSAAISTMYSMRTNDCARVPHWSETKRFVNASDRAVPIPASVVANSGKKTDVQAPVFTPLVLTSRLKIKVHKKLQLHCKVLFASDATLQCL